MNLFIIRILRIVVFSICLAGKISAQSAEAPRKVKIKIEKEKDGKRTELRDEQALEGRTMVKDVLRDYKVMEELGEVEEGEVVEIIIRRKKKHGPMASTRIEIDPIKGPPPPKKRPMLGVYYMERGQINGMMGNPVYTGEGAFIQSVIPGSAAQSAGFQSGDIILKVDDYTVGPDGRLLDIIMTYKSGDVVNVQFERFGRMMQRNVQLGTWNSPQDPFSGGSIRIFPEPKKDQNSDKTVLQRWEEHLKQDLEKLSRGSSPDPEVNTAPPEIPLVHRTRIIAGYTEPGILEEFDKKFKADLIPEGPPLGASYTCTKIPLKNAWELTVLPDKESPMTVQVFDKDGEPVYYRSFEPAGSKYGLLVNLEHIPSDSDFPDYIFVLEQGGRYTKWSTRSDH